ncbi:MAG: hypothetical protein LBQ54_11340 [Planctomycetaceae bacterium]|nr:hypothetical protein [Planctomycetaceae bacterium]
MTGDFYNPAAIGFTEVVSFRVNVENPKVLSVDADSNICVAGENKIVFYSRYGHQEREIPIRQNLTAMCTPKSETLFDRKILLAYENQVEVIEPDGKLLQKISDFPEGAWLVDIKTDKNHLYASDCVNKAVYVLDIEGKILQTLAKDKVYSDDKEAFPGFFVPSPYFAMDCDDTGTLWVANPLKHQLTAFSGGTVWEPSKTWGKESLSAPDAFTGCCNPADFAIFRDGRFVTVEKQVQKIKLFLPTGEFITYIANPSHFDPVQHLFEESADHQLTKKETSLWKPTLQVDVLSDDQVVVLDPENRKIFVFTEGLN